MHSFSRNVEKKLVHERFILSHTLHFDFLLNERSIQHHESSKVKYRKSLHENALIQPLSLADKNEDFFFENEQNFILMIFSIKYLLNMQVCEQVTSLRCLTLKDFFNLDRRSFRVIYEVKETFVDYNYLIQSSTFFDIFKMSFF